MNCKKCGNVLAPTDTVCSNCGEPVNAQEPVVNVQPENTVSVQPEQNVVPPVEPVQDVTEMSGAAPSVENNESVISTMDNVVDNTTTSAEAVLDLNQSLSNEPVIPQTVTNVDNVEPVNNTDLNTVSSTPVVENMADQPQPLNNNVVNNENVVNSTQPTTLTPDNTANTNLTDSNTTIQTNSQPETSNNLNNEKPKKKNFTLIIIVAVVVVILAVVGYFIATKKLSVNNTNNDNNNTNENTPNDTPNNDENTPNENLFTFKDFEFNIPQSYTVTENTALDSLELIDTTNKVLVEATIREYVSLDDYRSITSQIESDLTSQSLTVNSPNENSISNVNWIIFDAVTNGEEQEKIIEAFANLGDYHIMEIMIGNYGSRTTDEIISDLSTIISSGNYIGTTTFSPDYEKQPATYNVNISNLDKTKVG